MKKIVWLLLAVVIQLSACVEDGDMTDVEIRDTYIERFIYADVEKVEFEAESSSFTVHVTSIYSWTVSCSSWCTFNSVGDNMSYTIEASANTSLSDRSGEIVLTDSYGNKYSIGIVQKGAKQRDPFSSDNQLPS